MSHVWSAAFVLSVAATAGHTLEQNRVEPRHVPNKPDVNSPAPAVVRVLGVLSRRAPALTPDMRERVAAAIVDESNRAGFDPIFVLAIIDVESDFQPEARSIVGAQGLMQIMPRTREYLREREGFTVSPGDDDSTDPVMSVRLGVRYLGWLKERYGTLDLALVAYNAGPGRMLEAQAAGELERYRGYVTQVFFEYHRLRREEGLLAGRGFALRPRERS